MTYSSIQGHFDANKPYFVKILFIVFSFCFVFVFVLFVFVLSAQCCLYLWIIHFLFCLSSSCVPSAVCISGLYNFCFVCLRLVCPVLPVSLDYTIFVLFVFVLCAQCCLYLWIIHFFIVPSVFCICIENKPSY